MVAAAARRAFRHAPPNALSVADRQALVLSAMPGVHKLVLCYARRIGWHHVNDVLADAHLVLCRLAERFDPDGPAKFETYALGYLKKRVPHARAQRFADPFEWVCRSHNLAAVANDAADADPPGDGETPDDARERAEVSAAVDVLLAASPPKTREVVRAVVADGLTLDQVAAMRGVHPKMLALQLRPAFRRLVDSGVLPARLAVACGVAARPAHSHV